MTKHLLSLSSRSWCSANGGGNSRNTTVTKLSSVTRIFAAYGVFFCILKTFRELDNKLQRSFQRGTVVPTHNKASGNEDFWGHRRRQHGCFAERPTWDAPPTQTRNTVFLASRLLQSMFTEFVYLSAVTCPRRSEQKLFWSYKATTMQNN